jgi:hypothetical protein
VGTRLLAFSGDRRRFVTKSDQDGIIHHLDATAVYGPSGDSVATGVPRFRGIVRLKSLKLERSCGLRNGR